MRKIYILLLICAVSTNYSQQGFGTSNPAPSLFVIDVAANNKGALLPHAALTSFTVATPVTAGNVTPGYYYMCLSSQGKRQPT